MGKRWYLHTISGQVDRLDEHLAEHGTFAPYLIEVEPHTKSYDPEFYKPQTAAEYLASHKKAADKKRDNN